MENNKYYVYILLDPRHENRPFYVGKGSGDRAKVHFYETEQNTNNIRKVHKIRRIREAGLEPIINYHTVGLSESDAYALEIELIIQYGRAKIDNGGILTNIVIDAKHPAFIDRDQRGEKNHRFGKVWSDDQKQLRSDFNKLNGIKPPVRSGPMTAEQKAAIGAGNRGKKRTVEQSAYLSLIRKGKKTHPCTNDKKEKIRLSNILRFNPNALILPIDLTGLTIGSWTFLGKGLKTTKWGGTKSIYWRCSCSCSEPIETEISRDALIRRASKGNVCHKKKGAMSALSL